MNYIDKDDLLGTIDGIYESLLETAHEMENMTEKIRRLKENQEQLRIRLSHLRNIIKNDMIMIPAHNYSNEKKVVKVGMTVNEWNEYLERSTSSSFLITEDITPESSYKRHSEGKSSDNLNDLNNYLL
jgi:regulator of replication initiation timing